MRLGTCVLVVGALVTAAAWAPPPAAAHPAVAHRSDPRLRGRAQEHLLRRRGTRAWVGHHIGDLENYETLGSFTEGIEHFQRLFAVTPEVVAHDLHPEYLRPSTRWSATTSSWSASSTTTPTSRRRWPSTASRERRSARSSTAPATGRTARCGAGRSCPAISTASSGWARSWGAAARRGAGDPPAVADGVRVAVRGRRGRADAGRRSPGGHDAPGGRWRGWCTPGWARR